MWHRVWLILTFLFLIGCGGSPAEEATPISLTESAVTTNTLPPTFTPAPVEVEQPTPVTPASTPTDEPPTAVPDIIPTVADQPDALQFLVAAEVNLRRLESFSHERSIRMAYGVASRVPLELDVIKDRGALYQLTGMGQIESLALG